MCRPPSQRLAGGLARGEKRELAPPPRRGTHPAQFPPPDRLSLLRIYSDPPSKFGTSGKKQHCGLLNVPSPLRCVPAIQSSTDRETTCTCATALATQAPARAKRPEAFFAAGAPARPCRLDQVHCRRRPVACRNPRGRCTWPLGCSSRGPSGASAFAAPVSSFAFRSPRAMSLCTAGAFAPFHFTRDS